MKKCKNCAYFNTDDREFHEGKGQCNKILHPSMVHKLEWPKPSDVEGNKKFYDEETEYRKVSLAYVEDASCYYARLYVSEDFGCTLWEKDE